MSSLGFYCPTRVEWRLDVPIDLNSSLRATQAGVFVFSHPNHEAAVLGMMLRRPPSRIIYLTDGGGQHRVDETLAVLKRLGLSDRAIFLNRSESSAYAAILSRSVDYFLDIVTLVQAAVRDLDNPEVFCDAVEFYNPVHDMTVPIVKAAMAHANLFEVPLAYEAPTGVTVLQRPFDPASPLCCAFRLNDIERELKRQIVGSEYPTLRKEMAALIAADHTLTEIEWALLNRSWPIAPGAGLELIRSRGQFPKGGYDVHDGGEWQPATPATV